MKPRVFIMPQLTKYQSNRVNSLFSELCLNEPEYSKLCKERPVLNYYEYRKIVLDFESLIERTNMAPLNVDAREWNSLIKSLKLIVDKIKHYLPGQWKELSEALNVIYRELSLVYIDIFF